MPTQHLKNNHVYIVTNNHNKCPTLITYFHNNHIANINYHLLFSPRYNAPVKYYKLETVSIIFKKYAKDII